MPFIKGNTQGKGRPKGKNNKVSEASKSLFVGIMEEELDHVHNSLQLLREESAEKYLKALSSLFPYFMPKQLEQDVTINEPQGKPSWFDEVLANEDLSEDNPLLEE